MMQTDVKSFHATASGVAYNGRTRLKGVVISPSTSVTYNSTVSDTAGALSGTYSFSGSTTGTVTIVNHGLTTGQRVALDFTTGSGIDDAYVVTVVDADTFTIVGTVLTTSGNVTMYPKILIELDCSTGTSFYTLIPGEGIVATEGMVVTLPSASVTMTGFYG